MSWLCKQKLGLGLDPVSNPNKGKTVYCFQNPQNGYDKWFFLGG